MSKQFGSLVFFNDDDGPVYVLQRQPHPDKKQTQYTLWVEDEGITISTVKLSQLLADTLDGVVKREKHL